MTRLITHYQHRGTVFIQRKRYFDGIVGSNVHRQKKMHLLYGPNNTR